MTIFTLMYKVFGMLFFSYVNCLGFFHKWHYSSL